MPMTHDDDTIVILFNYGGGMRGLIPAHIMSRIELATGLPMSQMVDIFTGPSTGTILNTALNIPHPNHPDRPKYRARHMVKFYEREGSKIFPQDSFRAFRGLLHDFNNRTMKIGQLNNLFRHGHYDPSYLYKCLNELFGDHKLNDTLRSLVLPVYNIDGEQLQMIDGADENATVHRKSNVPDEGGHAVWLRNIKLKSAHRPTPDVYLRDAVMASCAAPTFFPCHHFDVKYSDDRGRMFYSGIDGSLFDNPCISYHGALRHYLPPDKKVIMIALGTGHTLRSFKKEDWNQFGGLGVVDPSNDLPLINIMFHASESALLESFSMELGDNFFNMNKSLVDGRSKDYPSMQIDDASPENLKKLHFFSEALIEENQDKFDKICEILAARGGQKKKAREIEKAKEKPASILMENLKKRLFSDD